MRGWDIDRTHSCNGRHCSRGGFCFCIADRINPSGQVPSVQRAALQNISNNGGVLFDHRTSLPLSPDSFLFLPPPISSSLLLPSLVHPPSSPSVRAVWDMPVLNGKHCTSHQWPLRALYNTASHSAFHSHIHPPRRQTQPRRATASSSGAVGARCLAQGHLGCTPLGGAGNCTGKFPVTSSSGSTS